MKVGDKLRCVNNSEYSFVNDDIELNKIYIVLDKMKIDGTVLYKIDDNSTWFEENSNYYNYFKNIRLERKEKLKKLNNENNL